MREWYLYLSARQKAWLILTLLAMIAVVTAGLLIKPEKEPVSSADFGLDNSISEIAPRLGVTGKALAKELKLDIDVPKKKPLGSLGVGEENLKHAVEHLLSHKDASIKYYIYLALVLGSLIFLVGLGKPENAGLKEGRIWYPRLPYVAVLAVSVLICGFLLGKSPNPMEGIVKLFKAMVGLYPSLTAKVIAFLFFLLLAIVANKVICGWACPFGALQELIYSLPLMRRLKKRKLPFTVTNAIRGMVFVAALLVLFAAIGGKKGLVIYHYVNPFNLFILDFDPVSILVAVLVVLVISFAVYRPFCQLVCPFGFVSWIFERFSFASVRVNHDTCTKCGSCIRACPLQAAGDRVDARVFMADCFSCMRCLNVCAFDSIRYRSLFNKMWENLSDSA